MPTGVPAGARAAGGAILSVVPCTRTLEDVLLDEVERAWAATYGPVLSMNFTPPGGSSLEVRFSEGTLRRVRESVATGSVTITLEEIR